MLKDNNKKISQKYLKHLSFEEFFQTDWRKYFQEKETIQSIMDASGLSGSHDLEQVNSTYLIDDDRVAVIALIKRKNTEVLDKLIIDVIAGYPLFEQFMDVIYSIGSGCDYRLIICDWNSKNNSPGLWMTDNIMRRLINYFNGHLSLYWLSADGFSDVDGSKKIVFTVIESVSKSDSSFDLPSRRDLEYAELMLYTWQASGYFSSEYDYTLNFRNYYEDECSRAEWRDECIVTEVSLKEDEYDWLWANKRDEIVDDNCSYSYDRGNGTLTVTEAIPFQNFTYSLPAVKSKLAENFYRYARMGSSIDNLLCEKDDEEPEESSGPEIDAGNMALQEIGSAIEHNEDLHDEPVICPSVQKFLGRNWKKYFQKAKNIREIVKAVNQQDKYKDFYRKGDKAFDHDNDGNAYDLVEVNSVIQLGPERLRIIATFLVIESGLFEKWAFDISPSPTLEQIFYALYDSEDDCAKKIILYFRNFDETDDSDPEIRIERESTASVLWRVSPYSDSIYMIMASVVENDLDDEKNKFDILFIPYPISFEHEKVPTRSAFENVFWSIYYHGYVDKFCLKSKEILSPSLITDTGDGLPYVKIPFFVWPEWTDKGLFFRLYAISDCAETNWLMNYKMDELKRRYNGHDLQIVMEPGIHYCVVIHLHGSPVSDFIESSALAKYNYASDVRKQQLDMIRHIEEIFQDYVPDEKLS